ncbi:MAG: hypothetical protein RIC18_18725 [Hoeflea sp.]|uniref:hypothetical protein n=1 Tax=Hoeflea sp. TaxID=1940281 RepID=UPI0032EF0552
MDLIERAKAEVINRHKFFVEWFTGRAPEAEMEASARAFASDMRMVEPDGSMIGADQVKAMLKGARGKRSVGFEIRVDLIEAHLVGSDAALVVYDEHQVVDGQKSARRSSALFSADKDAPEGVVWRHLQETWITQD